MATKKKAKAEKKKPLSLTVMTDVGRLSYPQLSEPHPSDAKINKDKYTCGILIPEETWKESSFAKKIKAAVVKVWADYSGEELEFKEINHPVVRMNSVKSKEIASFERDMIFLAAKSDKKYPPAVYGPHFDDEGNPVELKESQVEKLKGGDYARLVIRVFGWTFGKEEGVSFGLDSVQFIKTGEAFGAGKAAAQKLLADNEIDPDELEVDDVEDEDEEDDRKSKKKSSSKKKSRKVEEDEDDDDDVDDEDDDSEEDEDSDEDDSDDDSDDEEDEEEEDERKSKKGKSSSSKSSKSKASGKSKKSAKGSSRKKSDDDDDDFDV